MERGAGIQLKKMTRYMYIIFVWVFKREIIDRKLSIDRWRARERERDGEIYIFVSQFEYQYGDHISIVLFEYIELMQNRSIIRIS